MLRLSFVIGCIIGFSVAIGGPEGDLFGMLDATPVNDPFYPKQAPYLEAINVPRAWKRLASTRVIRKEVTVALIDSGVRPKHPDLVGNLVKGYNAIDGSYDTRDRDPLGHGTGMAGVLGATINNTRGIAGVMDLVNIMPICEGKRPSQPTVIAAIDYVVRHREARDIKFILLAASAAEYEPQLADKIRQADQAGLSIIVTAGNKGKNATTEKRYPCALTEQLSGVLCVAATELSMMKLASFSNYANYVDVAAPGVGIMTTGNYINYDTVSGTSPASAIVAGVVAMLYSLAPGLSPADIKRIIKETSKKGLKDSTGKVTLPFGRVDADKAVAKLIPR
ncbi:Suppressor of the cold-sensitive snRNP bioproteinsis mutant brr1-1 [Perkinsus chesapeaki]|uniref:subtilisin n=1 Tax=Perkinsus chesapeaki TaxID=330153 RepID=A0A7J6N263_PERCH|nr:Suppressor of the cold-sensitive snRNP bioproteinsis mutant brr1-1 [Perkinsus chesapeaki]